MLRTNCSALRRAASKSAFRTTWRLLAAPVPVSRRCQRVDGCRVRVTHDVVVESRANGANDAKPNKVVHTKLASNATATPCSAQSHIFQHKTFLISVKSETTLGCRTADRAVVAKTRILWRWPGIASRPLLHSRGRRSLVVELVRLPRGTLHCQGVPECVDNGNHRHRRSRPG